MGNSPILTADPTYVDSAPPAESAIGTQKGPPRLQIGELAESYCFWMVRNERVRSVREFVEHILAETANINADVYSIRVVYSLSTLEFDGTNTQYLKLTKDDLKQLQDLLDEIESETH